MAFFVKLQMKIKKYSTEISANGRKYLEEFIPQYVGILLSDYCRRNMDTEGGYLYNLNLSREQLVYSSFFILIDTFIIFQFNLIVLKKFE